MAIEYTLTSRKAMQSIVIALYIEENYGTMAAEERNEKNGGMCAGMRGGGGRSYYIL
jgi:hypothetical protein